MCTQDSHYQPGVHGITSDIDPDLLEHGRVRLGVRPEREAVTRALEQIQRQLQMAHLINEYHGIRALSSLASTPEAHSFVLDTNDYVDIERAMAGRIGQNANGVFRGKYEPPDRLLNSTPFIPSTFTTCTPKSLLVPS